MSPVSLLQLTKYIPDPWVTAEEESHFRSSVHQSGLIYQSLKKSEEDEGLKKPCLTKEPSNRFTVFYDIDSFCSLIAP